jgi:hypothetical protein
MLKFTKIQTRIDESIPFFNLNNVEEYKKYFYKTFVITNKFISSVDKLSEDKLTLKIEYTWASVEDYLDFITDEFCFINSIFPGREHELKHKIISTITIDGN